MLHTISLSDSIFALLDQEAKRMRLSPNQLAEKLLAEQLSAERLAWQTKFENLIMRVHSRIKSLNPDEIEGDITLASEEMKANENRR